MAYAAVQGRLPIDAWLLFIASLTWIVAYDTMYAMVDRDDDLKIGVRSTAFCSAPWTADDRLLQGVTLTALILLSEVIAARGAFQLGILAAAGFFLYQHYLIRKRQRDGCFAASPTTSGSGLRSLPGRWSSSRSCRCSPACHSSGPRSEAESSGR